MGSVCSSKGIINIDVTQLGQGGPERGNLFCRCFGLERRTRKKKALANKCENLWWVTGLELLTIPVIFKL